MDTNTRIILVFISIHSHPGLDITGADMSERLFNVLCLVTFMNLGTLRVLELLVHYAPRSYDFRVTQRRRYLTIVMGIIISGSALSMLCLTYTPRQIKHSLQVLISTNPLLGWVSVASVLLHVMMLMILPIFGLWFYFKPTVYAKHIRGISIPERTGIVRAKRRSRFPV